MSIGEGKMKKRFIIKYCGITDSVYLIDTLKRMPLEMIIHDKLYVHGLDCNDRETAEELQSYYEPLFGFQRPLFQEVTSFELRTSKRVHDVTINFYNFHYDIFDNTGRHVLGSYDLRTAVEFKEWLDMELKNG